jgi:hypothetical protein
MTLYQFNALNEMQQAEAIWEYGVLLDSRIEGEYKHILYQIDSFYVELHYHMEHNTLKGARVFANPDHLQPYLEKMTICI